MFNKNQFVLFDSSFGLTLHRCIMIDKQSMYHDIKIKVSPRFILFVVFINLSMRGRRYVTFLFRCKYD